MSVSASESRSSSAAGQVLVGGVDPGDGGAQHRPPHELLGERRGRTLGSSRDVGEGTLREEASGVQGDEAGPGRLVRQRDLGREVDAAGALGERALEVGGAVGREKEGDVGVAVEAVHDLEEQGLATHSHADRAVFGHEVDVLEDDERRLVGPASLLRTSGKTGQP